MLQLKEIDAASIITKSNLPDADYVINPYVGCVHGCIYCYAQFMRRFTGHSEHWGKFIDIKTNAPDLIPLSSEKYRGKILFMSSVTDPYLPLEKKYLITRRILERLIPLQPKLGVQTKSDLVVRDIDLLKQFKSCEVGLTITLLDDNLRREIELHAASVEQRIAALKQLHDAGIRTYVFIGPIMPFLTNWKSIILETKEFVDHYMFENLNVKGSIWGSISAWLKEKHPALLEKYKEIYFGDSSYWDDAEKEINAFCKERRVSYKIYFHHGE
jgi:DNA repair photolyase